MNRSDFVADFSNELMYHNEWMEFSEALDTAHHIWQEVWGSDVEDFYLEEIGEYAE